MRSETQARSHWGIVAGAFAGAAAFAFFAVTLIIHAAFGHGSAAGNILRIGLAIIFLFVGLFLVAVGTLYRMSFDEEHGGELR
jgi:hypothetical protein